MKRKSYRYICIIFLFAALCCIQCSCKKEKGDELPPLTFEGKNTIGCKINGVPWVPKGVSSGTILLYPTSGGYYYDPFFFPGVHIWLKTNSSDGYIELFVRNFNGSGYLQPGRYLLNKNTGDVRFGTGQIYSHGIYNNNGDYFTDSLHTGYIEILKSDSINTIISGRFEFVAFNKINGKSFNITDGRFDYKNH